MLELGLPSEWSFRRKSVRQEACPFRVAKGEELDELIATQQS
jgi:hypothetical protein